MTLGQKIYELRTGQGMTQEELAEQMGVSRQSVSKWESDSATPELEKIKLLSKLFGVSLQELLSEQPTNPGADYENLQEKISSMEERLAHMEASMEKLSKKPGMKLFLLLSAILLLLTTLISFTIIKVAVIQSESYETKEEPIVIDHAAIEDNTSYDVFSDWNWSVASVSSDSATATLQFRCTPKQYNDNTRLSVFLRPTERHSDYFDTKAPEGKDTYKTKLSLDENQGAYIGSIEVPINNDALEMSCIIDKQGEKENHL